jgi:predicted MFS family arabinose efflux permease
LAGTVIYASSPAARLIGRGDRKGPRDGLASVGFTSLLAAASLYGIAVGILTVTLIAFSSRHHARAAVGILIAIWGIGSILGGIAYGSTRWKTASERRALLLLLLLAALLALLATAPSLALLAFLMLVLGLPLSPWLGTLNEAVQRLVPSTRTAEAFTWTFALITTGIGVGNALGGPINESAGTGEGFLSAAAAAGGGAIVGLVALRVRELLPRAQPKRRA